MYQGPEAIPDSFIIRQWLQLSGIKAEIITKKIQIHRFLNYRLSNS